MAQHIRSVKLVTMVVTSTPCVCHAHATSMPFGHTTHMSRHVPQTPLPCAHLVHGGRVVGLAVVGLPAPAVAIPVATLVLVVLAPA